MLWYIQTYDKDNKAILGSGNGVFFHDLKTLRGVIKRLKLWHFRDYATTLKIYAMPGGPFQDGVLRYTGTIENGKIKERCNK